MDASQRGSRHKTVMWRCHFPTWPHSVKFRQVTLPVGHFHAAASAAGQAVCLLIPDLSPGDQLSRNSESYRLPAVVKGYKGTRCLCPVAARKN